MLLLEAVINRYLALDPELLQKMAALEGKVIKLEMTGINKHLYVYPGVGGLQIGTEHDGEVDTLLRGSPLSLFKMGLVTNVATMLLNGDVEISGDTRLGHQFKNIFAQMDIDWPGHLSALTGDVMAHQLQQTGAGVSQWLKQTTQSVSMSVSEYLQEESRDLLNETELQMFNDSVDKLRDDVDRLQLRINNFSSNSPDDEFISDSATTSKRS